MCSAAEPHDLSVSPEVFPKEVMRRHVEKGDLHITEVERDGEGLRLPCGSEKWGVVSSPHVTVSYSSSIVRAWKSGLLAWGRGHSQRETTPNSFLKVFWITHTGSVIQSLVCMRAILGFTFSEKILISLLAQCQGESMQDFGPLIVQHDTGMVALGAPTFCSVVPFSFSSLWYTK